jgi:ketosteroid isomerase-like protein
LIPKSIPYLKLKKNIQFFTMKQLLCIFLLLSVGFVLAAQTDANEKEIKLLEQSEVNAVLQKDTNQLKKLWDNDYVVYNPEGKIIRALTNSVDRPVLQNQRTSFTREVEQVIINGNIAISMGNETVVAAGNDPNSSQTIKRRYTNIWMKKDGSWKLIARHANKLCL